MNIYLSTNNINFTNDLFKMKKNFKSILITILNSFSQKYFQEIDIEVYYLQVRKYIDSIRITWLPYGLSGLTMINSTVVINSKKLMSHQSNKYFFEVYNNLEESSEIEEEEKNEEKPKELKGKSKELEEKHIEIEKKLNEDHKISKENQAEYLGSYGFVLMTCIHEFAHFIQRS